MTTSAFPECIHRRDVPGGVTCDHPRLYTGGAPISATACAECERGGIFCNQPLAALEGVARRRPPTTQEVSHAASKTVGENCPHRGTQVDTLNCPSCAGNVRAKVFSCDLHGRCVSLRKTARNGIDSCEGCSDSPTARRATVPLVGDPRNPCTLSDSDGRPVRMGNIYKGAAAFLLCGGPSLSSHDLSQLDRRGVLTMAVNNAAALHRPHLWTCVDAPGRFVEQIWSDPAVAKFVPRSLVHEKFSIYEGDGAHGSRFRPSGRSVSACPNVLTYSRTDQFDPRRFLSDAAFTWGRRDDDGTTGGSSVMLVALKLLFYLGVRQVFLIGCDFLMRDGGDNYAFPQYRGKQAVRNNNGIYRHLNRRFARLRPHLEAAGMQVVNCTPGGNLRAFDRMSFAAAVEQSRIKGPIVTQDRYERRPIS